MCVSHTLRTGIGGSVPKNQSKTKDTPSQCWLIMNPEVTRKKQVLTQVQVHMWFRKKLAAHDCPHQ